jgi:hypothetical protein
MFHANLRNYFLFIKFQHYHKRHTEVPAYQYLQYTIIRVNQSCKVCDYSIFRGRWYSSPLRSSGRLPAGAAAGLLRLERLPGRQPAVLPDHKPTGLPTGATASCRAGNLNVKP